jgi:hypothetical protein
LSSVGKKERKHIKKETKSLESHFKNFKKENQKSNFFFRLLKKRKHLKKATKSLGGHFKDFKKEKQKLKGFCRLLRRRKHMKKRQEAWEVILKILRRKSKN